MIFLAQIPAAPQMPPLPEGPSLDRVRGPVEIPAYEPWQIAILLGLIVLFIGLLIWLYVRSRRRAATTTPPYEAALTELQAATDLTAEDDEWESFKLWQDADGDGLVGDGELLTLDEMGIESIGLVSDGNAYDAADGDVYVHGESVVTYDDGTTGTAADAAFHYAELLYHD